MNERRKKSTFERGKFKKKINNALYSSKDIIKLLIGNTEQMTAKEIRTAFKKYVKSHLFIDDTITDTKSYIFYDVRMPHIHTTTKECKVVMFVLSHRDVLEEDCDFEGYYGNRVDILSEMIEDCLLNNQQVVRDFGIGDLQLESVEIFNNSKHFYGLQMVFCVPNFR